MSSLPINHNNMSHHLEDTASPPSDLSKVEELTERFSAVFSTLDATQLPLLGEEVFKRTHPNLTNTGAKPVVGEHLYSSYHVLFPLTFDTGLCWLVKIPFNGIEDKWDEDEAATLVAEAKTMQLLKRETTIPLPEVLDFSSTTKNPIRCPYILMSYIPGKSLSNVWFGHKLNGENAETNRARRTRALEGIAAAMLELGRFTFQSSGSPTFASDGTLSGTGPQRYTDVQAMIDRWFVYHDPCDDPIYLINPLCSDPKTCWIPEQNETNHFVLRYPDFNSQNFIVSEDGDLRGIIDWSGVSFSPRTVGCAVYPSWLTRDWDPIMYGYRESMDQGVKPEGCWEDSPSCLADCRQIYKAAIAKIDAASADICRMSLVTSNLAIAANNPMCREHIVYKIVKEIWRRTGQYEEVDFVEVMEMFGENKVDEAVTNALQTGFRRLLEEEGL
ncbi:hypothetical protein F4808DRAFT_472685 [Astrocystis sublimbata]|nr:hypothetical protein F4808DRAFT_472685 [Astrocystis sublimbata]